MSHLTSVNSFYESQPLKEEDTDSETTEDDQINTETDVVVPGKVPLLNRLIPRDRFGIVYIIFYFLGVSSLLPWNFFITANEYWMYKFRNVSYDHYNVSDPPKTEFQVAFTSYLCIASSSAGTIFLFLNTYFAHKIRHEVRLIVSLVIIISLFIYTTVLVEINTDCWQSPFFGMTLSSAFFLNAFSAVQQGGMFGILGKFPTRYMVAAVSGQALGGIFSSLASIVSIATGASDTTSALIYFLIADATLILSLLSYIVVTRMNFFVHHFEGHVYKNSSINNLAEHTSRSSISYTKICRKIWIYGVSISLTYVVSLSIFPSVAVLIESVHKGSLWSEKYFVPVICFLGFNSGDFVGRMVAGWIKWPRRGSPLVLLVAVLRVVLVPLFLYCNVQPRSHLPVLFDQDYQYILLFAALALSNGYLSTLTFMYTPQVVEKEEQETAASMLTFFLSCGVSIGILFSFLLITVP